MTEHELVEQSEYFTMPSSQAELSLYLRALETAAPYHQSPSGFCADAMI